MHYHCRMSVLKALEGTQEAEILAGMEAAYRRIEEKQRAWKESGAPLCIDGCGACCEGFEPDVLPGEALYLAAWLIDNEPERARQIADGSYEAPAGRTEGTCIFFDPAHPWHCTTYGGRCLICRLFGYSGDYGRDGRKRFRPCRFYPAAKLQAYGMEHRQYSEDELQQSHGAVPPAMADCVQQVLSLTPGSSGETAALHEALPGAIRRLQWILRWTDNAGPQSA